MELYHVRVGVKLWKRMMDLFYFHTWELVDLFTTVKIVECKWVYSIISHPNGTFNILLRLYLDSGMDFIETFSPIGKLNLVCILIHVATNMDWPLIQLDAKNTFLYGGLAKTIFMEPCLALLLKGVKVCNLKKGYYGL